MVSRGSECYWVLHTEVTKQHLYWRNLFRVVVWGESIASGSSTTRLTLLLMAPWLFLSSGNNRLSTEGRIEGSRFLQTAKKQNPSDWTWGNMFYRRLYRPKEAQICPQNEVAYILFHKLGQVDLIQPADMVLKCMPAKNPAATPTLDSLLWSVVKGFRLPQNITCSYTDGRLSA